MGDDRRQLCIEVPSKDTLVPADDEVWERGVSPSFIGGLAYSF